jgi:hypothetical protein
MASHDVSEDWVSYNVPMGNCEITEEFVEEGKLYFEIELDDQHISMLIFRTKDASGIRSAGEDNMLMSIPLDPEMMMRLIKIHRAMGGWSTGISDEL